MERLGWVWFGKVWLLRFGKARLGKVWYGLARSGPVWILWRGMAGYGGPRYGLGVAGSGVDTMVW